MDETDFKMEVETWTRRGVATIVGVYLVVFLLGTAATLALPPYLVETSDHVELAVVGTNTTWSSQVGPLTEWNRELQVHVTLENLQSSTEALAYRMVVRLELEGSMDGTVYERIVSRDVHSRTVHCDLDRSNCSRFTVFHEPHLHYAYYRMVVEFEEFPPWLGDRWYEVQYGEASTTFAEVVIRACLVFVNLAFLIVYSTRFMGVPFAQWTLEQKGIFWLLFSIVGYLNPLYVLTVTVDSWTPVFVDVVTSSFYVSVVLIFWLVYFDALGKPTQARQSGKFWWPKISIVALHTVLDLTAWTWVRTQELDDPEYTGRDDVEGWRWIRRVGLLMSVIYLIYLGAVIGRAVKVMREGSRHLHRRGMFMLVFSLVNLMSIFGAIFLGTRYFTPLSSDIFMVIFLLNCLYPWVLSVVYRPAQSELWAARGDASMLDAAHASTELPEMRYEDLPDDAVDVKKL